MNCPYCNEEMEMGCIESARGFYFTKKPHTLVFSPKVDEIPLAPVNVFDGSRHSAFHCKNCKTILIKYLS